MKKAKAPRVPILESTFEVNLPKLLRTAKTSGCSMLVLDVGLERTVAALSNTRLAVHLGGRIWLADIVAVPCLNDRVRSLLKCPRAHEGNFQSLYYRAGELACRHCHKLRYRSNLAGTEADRARLARQRLIQDMGGQPGDVMPRRAKGAWRTRYARLIARLAGVSDTHYHALKRQLQKSATIQCAC